MASGRTIDYCGDESYIPRCLSSDPALRKHDRAKASIFHSFIRRGLVRAFMSLVVVCIYNYVVTIICTTDKTPASEPLKLFSITWAFDTEGGGGGGGGGGEKEREGGRERERLTD